MANYCFAESEGRYALFAEAAVRGWVAAVGDFPQRRDREECTAPALLECDALLPEVCCITDPDAYRQLVVSAWAASYVATGDATEREMVMMAYLLKTTSVEETYAVVRQGFLTGGARREIEKAYAQFIAKTG